MFHVKNQIVPDEKPMSLAQLVDHCVKESFCIDKINFKLECFNLQFNKKPNVNELKKLAAHLRQETSHKSAVGLLQSPSNDQEPNVGHAISMYDFDVKNQSFCYIDSSMKAYKYFQSAIKPPSKGLHLRLQDCQLLEKAWTFIAEYNVDV